MSLTETDNGFQNSKTTIDEKEAARILGQSLQNIFPDSKEGIKAISRDIGANHRTVWNWYNGLNMPNTASLILLAKAYPGITKSLLKILDRIDIWEAYEKQIMVSEAQMKKHEISEKSEFYSDIFVGINLTHNLKLNQRQLWFIKRLQLGLEAKSTNIIGFWNVSARTAERDISVLVNRKIVKFVGSKKNGSFKIRI